MRALLGSEFPEFLAAFETPSPTSVRANPNKPGQLFAPDEYDGQIPWCPDAYYLKNRPTFTLDPCFHCGAYYVQEASSMFLAAVLRQLQDARPLRVLDLCAAPGGKSTLLASLLSRDSLLVANEVIKPRAAVLKENIVKWGQDNIVVTSGDPSRFAAFPGAFDIILVDAPCSGEGMFRKDEKAVGEWSENNLRLCEERQKRILSDIWPALRPEGFLIYSTCTYNPGENDDALQWLTRDFAAVPVPARDTFPGITPTLYGQQFYPHKTRGEGLYMGVVQKTDGETFTPKKEKRQPDTRPSAGIKDYFPDSRDFVFYQSGPVIGAMPSRHADFIRQLESRVNVLYKGCEIGEDIKGKIKPSPALALYSRLDKDRHPCLELDLPAALRYLRREDIRMEAPRGEWTLLSYCGFPLGWAKEVGSRLNNYYPKEWRIRNL